MPLIETERITLEDVTRVYPPKLPLNYHPPIYDGPVVAVGRAIYEAQPQAAVDSWTRFVLGMTASLPPGNLWLLPTYPRMTFPYSAYWPLACAFQTERHSQRRFDWFLWLDDDVEYTLDDVQRLFDAAKQHDLEFVAALPYDRCGTHQPAVVEEIDGELCKWIRAPASGSYPVSMVGFCMCLFRRTVFDKVPEPWFGVCAPMRGFSGVAPDWWWCLQMKKAGLQPWVCCDTNLRHLGERVRVDRTYSEQTLLEKGIPPCAVRGELTPSISPRTGATVTPSPVYPDGRVSPPQQKAEPEAEPRRAVEAQQTLEPKQTVGSCDDKTVCILTCDRDKDLMELTAQGLALFWPQVKVAILHDQDRDKETPLPDDVRECVRRVPFLRKVFDLPYIAPTDLIVCLDSDCFLFDAPNEIQEGRALYVAPGSMGRQWLQTGNEVWRAIGHGGIRTDVIFCGGCWCASRKKMFEDQRDLAIAYVRECMRRGLDHDPYAGVICEQCLLNGLFHRVYQPDPLPNHRFVLDEPNAAMAIYHVHQQKDTNRRAEIIAAYRQTLAMKRGEI